MVFGKLANLPSSGVPYPLLVLTGVLPWQFFSQAFSDRGNSLVANAHVIGGFFPAAHRADFDNPGVPQRSFDPVRLPALVLVWFAHLPGWQIIFLPAMIVLTALTAAGFGFIAASISARYRDVRHLIPFALQLGVFISPVAYATSIVPVKWLPLFALNPVVGLVDGYRWCISAPPT